jgi:signal transduction histidine kinase
LYPYDPAHWIIEVKDTGIGISETVLEFIFEPLRRAPDFAVRRRQGAGLGLSITKELVNLMGGSIEVKSKAGKGSTFRVKLPIEEADDEKITGGSYREQHRHGRYQQKSD